MAGITSAVVGTAVAVKGQRDAKKAQQSAAAQQEQAAARSAQLIGEAGRAGERDILGGQRLAGQELVAGMEEAVAQIDPFTRAAAGIDIAQQRILGQEQLGGPLAESIRQASLQGAQTPLFGELSDPVQREMARQANINVSAATPEVTAAQLTQGAQGLGAAGDIARIRQRAFESLSGLAEGSAAARASALIGQTTPLQQLAASQQEARVLGDVAGQRATAGTIEELAGLAGQLQQRGVF